MTRIFKSSRSTDKKSRLQRWNSVWSLHYCDLLLNLCRWMSWWCQNLIEICDISVCVRAQNSINQSDWCSSCSSFALDTFSSLAINLLKCSKAYCHRPGFLWCDTASECLRQVRISRWLDQGQDQDHRTKTAARGWSVFHWKARLFDDTDSAALQHTNVCLSCYSYCFFSLVV